MDELYRSGIPAWRSAGWKPEVKERKRGDGGHLGMDVYHIHAGHMASSDVREEHDKGKVYISLFEGFTHFAYSISLRTQVRQADMHLYITIETYRQFIK